MAITDKNGVVHGEKINIAIGGDDLDLLSFIVCPLLDFNLLHCSIWPSSDGIMVSIVRVKHVKVATARDGKSENRE